MKDGLYDGNIEGAVVGAILSEMLGSVDGLIDGIIVGLVEGNVLGSLVGSEDGSYDGIIEGAGVGATLGKPLDSTHTISSCKVYSYRYAYFVNAYSCESVIDYSIELTLLTRPLHQSLVLKRSSSNNFTIETSTCIIILNDILWYFQRKLPE